MSMLTKLGRKLDRGVRRNIPGGWAGVVNPLTVGTGAAALEATSKLQQGELDTSPKSAMPKPDDEMVRLAKRESLKRQKKRKGRASTIMTMDL